MAGRALFGKGSDPRLIKPRVKGLHISARGVTDPNKHEIYFVKR